MSFLESNLGKRISSGIAIGIPILIIVYIGGTLFDLVAIILATLCAWEWANMTGKSWMQGYGLISSSVIISSIVLYILADSLSIALIPIILGLIACYYFKQVKNQPTKWIAIGFLYLAIPLMMLCEFRIGYDSSKEFFVLLLTTWGVDIGAYAFGRKLKGPKIAPKISPNKTWAGLLGGIVGATLVLEISQTEIFNHSIGDSFPAYLLMGTLTAVIGQIGDFWESGIKRKFGVKDSSNIIPGHGGILDRIDGLLAIAVVWGLIVF